MDKYFTATLWEKKQPHMRKRFPNTKIEDALLHFDDEDVYVFESDLELFKGDLYKVTERRVHTNIQDAMEYFSDKMNRVRGGGIVRYEIAAFRKIEAPRKTTRRKQ